MSVEHDVKRSKTARQINSLLRAEEGKRKHPRQVRHHYATVNQVKNGGFDQMYYGACWTLGCWKGFGYTFDRDAVVEWCNKHNDLVTELSEKAKPEIDWDGGRALMPWELGYSIDERLAILFGPGSVGVK